MIIILKPDSTATEQEELKSYLSDMGVKFDEASLNGIPVISIDDGAHILDSRIVEEYLCVQKAVRLTASSPLALKKHRADKKKITVNGIEIGGSSLAVIAGPCSIESYQQLKELAIVLRQNGIKIMRAGAFKPRTSPYSFQGMGKEGIEALAAVKAEIGLAAVTEIMDTRDLEIIEPVADIFQVGMRNMRNYPLLKELGKARKPVLLKRAMDASVEEWLLASEYILKEGNDSVILCERGVLNSSACGKRTVMDLNGALEAMEKSRLPLIIDPSHAAGERSKVAPLAKAAVAAGADGLMFEVHSDPSKAMSDGFQALRPEQFSRLLKELYLLKEFIRNQVENDT